MRPRLRAAPWLLVLLWGSAYLPGLLRGQTLPGRDLGATQVPWRTLWAAQVRSGQPPLWDPLSNGGRPLLANPNAMAAYPGSALFLVLSPERGSAWHVALHHLGLLLALYLLARRSGASAEPAALAAMAVGTSGVAWSAATFLNLQASLMWGALALATAVPPPAGPVAARRRSVVAGGCLGLAFLAGEPVTAGLSALAWVAVVFASWPARGRLGGPVLAGLTALGVSAPVLFPLVVLLPDTVRGAAGADPGALAADALAPRRWLELVFPRVLGEPLGDRANGFWAAPSFPWQRFFPLLFVGAMPLLLAPFLPRRREWRPWWVMALLGGAGAVALASPSLAELVARLPGAGSARFGIKLLVLPLLAAPPLLAAAWPELVRRWQGAGRRAAAAVMGLGMAGAAVGLVVGPVVRPALARAYPEAASSLGEVGDAELRRSVLADGVSLAAPAAVLLAAGPVVPVALLVGGAANLLAGGSLLRWDAATPWAAPPAAVREVPPGGTVFFRDSPAGGVPHGDRGLERSWQARTALEPNHGARWGLGYVLDRGPDGLETIHHDHMALAARVLPAPVAARLARNLGASAVVTVEALEGWECNLAPGVALCAASGDVPPAYLAERGFPAADLPAVRATLTTLAFRRDRDVVLPGLSGVVHFGSGRLRELPGAPHHRRFSVSSEGETILVVRQSFTRQWRALVAGFPARVLPVNGCQLGVSVPAGDHEVSLYLDPGPYRVGAAGPLLALLLGMLAWRSGARPRRGVLQWRR